MACICDKPKEEVIATSVIPPVSRRAIVAAARELIGVPFLHQGRNPETGLDCVGFCIEVVRRCGVQKVYDLQGYKRIPAASVLRDYLTQNLDEIPLDTARRGDFLLMKLGGAKPRHVSIISDDRTDYAAGIEPRMVHALSTLSINRVIEQPIAQYRRGIVAAFQVRRIEE